MIHTRILTHELTSNTMREQKEFATVRNNWKEQQITAMPTFSEVMSQMALSFSSHSLVLTSVSKQGPVETLAAATAAIPSSEGAVLPRGGFLSGMFATVCRLNRHI